MFVSNLWYEFGWQRKPMPNSIWKPTVLQIWVQKEQQAVETLVLHGRNKEEGSVYIQEVTNTLPIDFVDCCLQNTTNLKLIHVPQYQHIFPKRYSICHAMRFKAETKLHKILPKNSQLCWNQTTCSKQSSKSYSWTKHFLYPFPWWPPCASPYVSQTQLASWLHWPSCRQDPHWLICQPSQKAMTTPFAMVPNEEGWNLDAWPCVEVEAWEHRNYRWHLHGLAHKTWPLRGKPSSRYRHEAFA